jgi:hypothetical protein
MKEWLKHRAVRIAAKVVLGVLGAYVLLLLLLQLLVTANKQALLNQVNQKLNDGLQGEVRLGNLKVNVWRHFPKVELVLENLTVADTVYHKPIIAVQTISSDLGWTDVLGKHIRIQSVRLSDGYVRLFADSTGYNNHYLLKPRKKDRTGSSGSHGDVFIQQIELHNITASTTNTVKNKHFEILFRQATAGLQQTDSAIGIHLKEKALVKGLGFNLAKGSYLENKEIDGDWHLSFNPHTKALRFPETTVQIDKHPFHLQGVFYLLDSTQAHFALQVKTKKIHYRQAAGLLTANIRQKLLKVNLEDPIDVEAGIEGSMAHRSIPLVKVNWSVVNNTLLTPGMGFGNCSFTGSFCNEMVPGKPRTDDNSIIKLANFQGDWGGILLKGNDVVITNLLQPNLKFRFSSACTFPMLDDKFAMRTLRLLSGEALLELQYDGPLATDVSVMEKLSGRLLVTNGVVHYEPRNLTFTQCNGELLFSSNDIAVKKLECNVGDNHFEVSLAGKDINKLATGNPGKGSLACTVYTPSLNLADFTSLFSKKNSFITRKKQQQKLTATGLQFDDILEKGTLQLDIRADNIRLHHFTANRLTGRVLFESNDWQLQNISLQHAGGTLAMQGRVRELNGNHHTASTHIQLENVDIRRLFYAFDNFGQNGITYQSLEGKLYTQANISVGINNKGSLVPGSLNGNVYFSLRDGALVNYEPIQRIQKFVFKNRDLKNIRFAELKDSLIIKNDEVYIRRMEVQSNVMTLYIEGLYSMKGNTDISIQVPLNNFLEKRANERPRNKGIYHKTGASIYLRAKPDLKGNIKIGLDLFKKFRKKRDDTGLPDSL